MSTVRTRVAPSPTGDPHVGTAYMALFNYAFAKSQGGQFLLRIEDTDQSRSRVEYEQAIIDALHWLGLQWDEGPDQEGPHKPYRQSQRTEHYQQYAHQLVDRGQAYYCFCTQERLERMRDERREMGLSGYDGHCRSLDPAEADKRIATGEPHVIRMVVPPDGEMVTFTDRLRGEISIDAAQVDDQILIKQDGHPTYHLAVVVDDHLMEISHVIRGEEWISSTPKHVLLYRALGWDEPEWVHMPLLRNPDKSKLSKRKNPTSINFYQRMGYLPEALLNFLGLMGYSAPKEDEKFTLDQFIERFEIDKVQLGGPVWDIDKLNHFNARWIREEHTPEQLFERLRDWALNEERLGSMVPMVQERLETLADFVPQIAFLLSREAVVDPEVALAKGLETNDAVRLLQCYLWELELLDRWDRATAKETAERVAAYCERKIRDMTHLLFVTLTGKPVGPPIYDSIELLGKEMVRHRLRSGLAALAGQLGKKKLKKLEKFWSEARG